VTNPPARLLETMNAELTRTRGLVENLMTLARADGRGASGGRSEVDLDDLVDHEVRRLHLTSDRAVAVEMEPVRVRVDAQQVAQPLRNVVDDAEHHARSTVRLVRWRTDEEAVLWVDLACAAGWAGRRASAERGGAVDSPWAWLDDRPLPDRGGLVATDAVSTNMRAWDGRVPEHLTAYRARALADDPTAIGVQVEADLLAPHLPGGTVAGLDVVHLQCHIGTDTISLARRGARVVGTDLSRAAIDAARELAARAGATGASFVQCSNEEAPEVLGRQFDVVLTSVGVLAWLGDLRSWARAVARLLRPGGVFLVYDGHPMMSALQHDREDGSLVLKEPYFSTAEPARFEDGLSYASGAAQEHRVTYQWQHDLAEIVTAVLSADLHIEALGEHRSMPWSALPGMVATEHGFELPPGSAECPLMFSLVARR